MSVFGARVRSVGMDKEGSQEKLPSLKINFGACARRPIIVCVLVYMFDSFERMCCTRVSDL